MAKHVHTPTPAPLARTQGIGAAPRALNVTPTEVDFRQMVCITDHRDADLLDLIERFSDMRATAWRLINRAERLKADSRAYRRLWAEANATGHEQLELERVIISKRAQTALGAIAKANMFLDMHADNDGLMMALPRAAITELMALLDGAGA